MRTLLKFTIPTETGNAKLSDGTLPKTLESILNDLKPEACYFASESGQRNGFVVFDLKDPSQIPSVAEPFFIAFNASVEFHPVMNLQDLQKALSGIESTVKRYRPTTTARAA